MNAARRLTLLALAALAPALLLLVITRNLNARTVRQGELLIDALLYDGYEANDADEALALINSSDLPISLDGWKISDGSAEVELPHGLQATAGRRFWLAKDGDAFSRQFGFEADAVLTSWPGFANNGDEVLLLDASGAAADAVVYEDGDIQTAGWQGAAVQPYVVRSVFGQEGQLLFRKRQPHGGGVAADTDTVNDWAQDRADVLFGRKVRYPGWEEDAFPTPATRFT